MADTLGSILKTPTLDGFDDELDLVMAVSGDLDDPELINAMNDTLANIDAQEFAYVKEGVDLDDIIDPIDDEFGPIDTSIDYSDVNTGDFLDVEASKLIASEGETIYDDGVEDELIDIVLSIKED